MPDVEVGSVPFQEAIDHFRGKLNIPTRTWDEMLAETNAKAFTVAGATKIDLLNDIRGAVDQAISEGTTITEFRRKFDETVQEHGWTYRGKRGWRTRIIFDTNLRTSHHAGRWAQIQRTKGSSPFLQYLTVDDSRVRPEHRVWHRMVLNIDDPWWNTHYPPNGWGCRCTVRTLNDRQLKREGSRVEEGPAIKTTERVNERTGEIYGDVPVGIDTGWDYNVGQAWLAPDAALGEKIMRLPASFRSSAISATAGISAKIRNNYKAWAKQAIDSDRAGSQAPVAYLTDSVVSFLIDKGKPPATSLIILSDHRLRRMERQLKVKKSIAIPRADLLNLASRIQSPEAILWDKQKRNLVYVFSVSADVRKAKAVVSINFRHKRELGNQVRSGGLVDIVNLRDKARYELIEGEL